MKRKEEGNGRRLEEGQERRSVQSLINSEGSLTCWIAVALTVRTKVGGRNFLPRKKKRGGTGESGKIEIGGWGRRRKKTRLRVRDNDWRKWIPSTTEKRKKIFPRFHNKDVSKLILESKGCRIK